MVQNKRGIYIDIGRRIKFFREKTGLRQSDIAEKLNVSINYISQIERGLAEVSLFRLNQIVEHGYALDKPILKI